MVKKQMQMSPMVDDFSQHMGEGTTHLDLVQRIPELVQCIHQRIHCDHWGCFIGMNSEGPLLIPYSKL